VQYRGEQDVLHLQMQRGESKMITDKQWQAVKIRTDKLKEAFVIFEPLFGGNTLDVAIEPLLKRYDEGERTQKLYDEMKALI
jgi:hypothetical protein